MKISVREAINRLNLEGHMRALLLILFAISAAVPVHSQERDSTRRDSSQIVDEALPRHIALEIVERYNRNAAMRASGSLAIPVDGVVEGDVAVLNGPLSIAGRVRGGVVVINGDVLLKQGARIEGDLVVVGGVIEGQKDAIIEGAVRWYRQALAYHQEGDVIVADRETVSEGRFGRAMRRYLYRSDRSRLSLTTGGVYNRVEGLPIYLGPTLRFSTPFGRFSLDAYGILRTAKDFNWDRDGLGHDVRSEFQFGRDRGFAVGGRLFDIVDGVENWHLKDTEVGLASFFLHRDFRDYYDRHGGLGYVRLFRGPVGLTLSYGEERWGSREVRDPLTVFRNGRGWRPNPQLDEGKFRLATAAVAFDTRNDAEDPWTGWLISADIERGTSRAVLGGPTAAIVRDPSDGPSPVSYTRGFLDLRRYNRLSPEAQINLRVVLGGWLGGDPLPLQKRFSLGGAGTLPGFDFRDLTGEDDRLTCGGIELESRPAQCERVALVQLEYRGDINVNLGRGAGNRWPWSSLGFHRSAEWVLFADAGRGWLVGRPIGEMQYRARTLPALHTFRTDLGAGLDFYYIGFFLAKSLSNSGEPANFFVRVRHRF
ncbi:MAG: BamA/TamA family outer membrane protein [Anaerolineae bacterium]|nr:BamA/TamA family outer membrane protein [Gemmatimonadaceae bacterium]